MSEDNYMQAQAISTTFGYQEEDETPSNNGRAYATIKSNNKWKRKLGIWISKHLSKKQFTLILALLVGLGSAIAAQLLKLFIHEIEFMLTSQFDVTHANWLFLIYPVVGIYLTALFIKYIVRDDIGHGVTKILYAL